jgi:hypothetical protein
MWTDLQSINSEQNVIATADSDIDNDCAKRAKYINGSHEHVQNDDDMQVSMICK